MKEKERAAKKQKEEAEKQAKEKKERAKIHIDLERSEAESLPKTLIAEASECNKRIMRFSEECEAAIRSSKPEPLSFTEEDVLAVCRDAQQQHTKLKPVLDALMKAKDGSASEGW